MITLVMAVAENGVIGKEDKLPWRIKSELQYFKQLTWGRTLYVGKTTAKTLPPLPGREVKVISKTEGDVRDLRAFLEMHQYSDEEIFIIGGGSIYAQALPYASKAYISLIHGEYEGDTYFDMDLLKEWLPVQVQTTTEFTAYEYHKYY